MKKKKLKQTNDREEAKEEERFLGWPNYHSDVGKRTERHIDTPYIAHPLPFSRLSKCRPH